MRFPYSRPNAGLSSPSAHPASGTAGASSHPAAADGGPNAALRAQIEQKLKSLPMLPSVVGELISLDQNAEDYGSRVSDIATREPALAAKLLSVANGATSAPARQIQSLHDAVMRLGAKRVATLVTTFAVMRVFVPTTQVQRDLWRHALETAVAAQEIAAASPLQVPPQRAYIAGLLHDIGRFVMFEYDPQDFLGAETADWNAPKSLIQSEREHFSFDHCQVGAIAAREWRLPREFSDVITNHHNHASLTPAVAGANVGLVRTVQQAECVSGLLLRDAERLKTLTRADLERELAVTCFCPTWGGAPLAIHPLAQLMPTIHAKGLEQLAALGAV